MTYYLHELPGRIRIKIPTLKRNPRAAGELESFINTIAGVVSASANTVTGSMVINFEPDVVGSQQILALLAHEGYIDLTKAMSSHQYATDAISKAGQAASRALLGLALNRALDGTSLAFLTVLI